MNGALSSLLWFAFGHGLVPLVLWTMLFVAATLLAGLWLVRRCRRRLESGGPVSPGVRVGLSLVALGALPLAAVVLAASFSLHRSIALAAERGGQVLIDWSGERAAASLREGLGVADDTPVAVADLRERIAARRSAIDIGPVARIGHPIVLVLLLPGLLEEVWWRAADSTLRTFRSPTVTVRQLSARTAELLRLPGGTLLRHLAARFRDASHAALWLLLGLVAGVHALALAAVEWQVRRRRTIDIPAP